MVDLKANFKGKHDNKNAEDAGQRTRQLITFGTVGIKFENAKDKSNTINDYETF